MVKKRSPPAVPSKPAEVWAAVREECLRRYEEFAGRPWSDSREETIRDRIDEPFDNDTNKVCQALLNALSNAEKHMHHGPQSGIFRRWAAEHLVPFAATAREELKYVVRKSGRPISRRSELIRWFDHDDFLGLGRPATTREVAVVSLLCGNQPRQHRDDTVAHLIEAEEDAILHERKAHRPFALDMHRTLRRVREDHRRLREAIEDPLGLKALRASIEDPLGLKALRERSKGLEAEMPYRPVDREPAEPPRERPKAPKRRPRRATK